MRALPWTPARRFVDRMFPQLRPGRHNLKAWWQQ